ncbi:MAG: precorrin-2 C(20)-methyltransferase [Desulfatitalea sp.]|nr:precorrin-2 C(20)-methyltransferase [Desulfatitalea sp.]NNJ99364.1 precorrin-2 C(20)-methyltransferase [Desulfatitalea sp.]
MTTGTLYGIGVGPGDPELIPLKAVRVLGQVDLVFTAASTKNDYSLAMEIVQAHIPAGTPVERLEFPMCREQARKEEAWRQHAEHIAGALLAGKSAAFLTLGDPLTYSTYGYVLRHLKAGWPQLDIHTIPGITSYQAAAAAINQPLVEGEESLVVLSGVHGGEKLLEMTRAPENVVFMKAYRNVDGICEALEQVGMADGSVAVSNCSRPDEQVYNDLCGLERRQPNYWTLIIAKRKDHGTQG